MQIAGDSPVTLYRAGGCEHCGHTGYSGRSAIVELLVMTDPIKQLVLKHSDAGEITRAAAEGGMQFMLDDGLRKAVAGETTIEEVRRVTQEQSHTQLHSENPATTEAAELGTASTERDDTAENTATDTTSQKEAESPPGSHLTALSRFMPRK